MFATAHRVVVVGFTFSTTAVGRGLWGRSSGVHFQTFDPGLKVGQAAVEGVEAIAQVHEQVHQLVAGHRALTGLAACSRARAMACASSRRSQTVRPATCSSIFCWQLPTVQ